MQDKRWPGPRCEVELSATQAALVGEDCRLDPVAGTELAEYALHVGLDGRLLDYQGGSDLAVGEPAGNELQHLALPRCQLVQPGVVGRVQSGLPRHPLDY